MKISCITYSGDQRLSLDAPFSRTFPQRLIYIHPLYVCTCVCVGGGGGYERVRIGICIAGACKC